MNQDDQIESIIMKSINIIEDEINTISSKQDTHGLEKPDTDKVIDFLKTMVLIQRDRRQIAKDEMVDSKELTKEELALEIAKEKAKLNAKTE